jgi:type II secretory pathway pseudopilin PulG
MELMAVVLIVGILSAIAIPSFSGYIYKSRTTEAIDFLGTIRLREESYRSEFGVYCPTVADYTALATNSNLSPDPSTTRRNAGAFPGGTAWAQLGANPTGPVRFGYGVAAGTPSSYPNVIGFSAANADFWFIARAVSDLDADSTYATFEIYSPTKSIWIGGPDGNALASGWE